MAVDGRLRFIAGPRNRRKGKPKTDSQSHRQRLAFPEDLGWQHQNLVETIARLLGIMQSMPPGKARCNLLEEISALDVIAEMIRKEIEDI